MGIESLGHEHEFEPQYGLPERLPAGERLLWQGSPDFRQVARTVFRIHLLGGYFGLLIAYAVGSALAAGGGPIEALQSIKWLAPLAAVCLGAVALLAWLTARTTVYTLTDKRVVMRVGIVLTVTFNLPLRAIASAALRRHSGQFGDVTLSLAGPDRIAYLQLWPSVRPWRFTRTEPMLRCIAEADVVSARLQQAWSELRGLPVPATQADIPTATQGSEPRPAHWQASPT